MRIKDKDRFESNNNLAINIYIIDENAKGNSVSPLRISSRKVPLSEYINLLLIEGKNKSHYTWIKNFPYGKKMG